MLGAEVVAKIFKKNDIGRVYVYPGGTIAPILDALKHEDIPVFCARHEQGAGYAALAHARLSKTPQVVMVTSGPGVTNIVTTVADAYFDSTPLIVITGQVGTGDLASSKALRQRGFQEVNACAIMSSITKKTYLVDNVAQLQETIEEAFALSMSGRLGPVHIDMPMDVQRSDVDLVTSDKHVKTALAPIDVDNNLKSLTRKILSAKRPIIIAGQGVYLSDAVNELRELVQLTNIPVVCSLMGIGIFSTKSKLAMGFLGHTGMHYANVAVHEADLVIVIGARLDVRQTGSMVADFAPKAFKARIDIDKAEVNYARVKIDLSIIGECKSVIAMINAALSTEKVPRNAEWLSYCQQLKSEYSLPIEATQGYLSPQRIIQEVNRMVGDKQCVVTTGVGSHQHWVARHFDFDFPRRRWLTSGGHGAMGYDLPSAVGVALAYPEALSICFVGDGSFQINIQELGAIMEFNLPVKIIVLDNERLGIVSQFQKLNWGDDPTTGQKLNPSFSDIARSYGIRAFYVDAHSGGVEEAIQQALNHDGPSLVHCKVDPYQEVIPMLMAGQKMNEMWYPATIGE